LQSAILYQLILIITHI